MDCQDDEFDDFLDDFCGFYKGTGAKRVRFLLTKTLPFHILDAKIKSLNIINALKDDPDETDETELTETKSKALISPERLAILYDIATITRSVNAKNCVKDFAKKKKISVSEGQGLKIYRKLLYEGLINATRDDFQQLTAFYNIDDFNYQDIWDAVHHLEKSEKLETRYDLKRFAKRCLNKAAKSKITVKLEKLVVRKEDGKLSPDTADTDLLEDLVEITEGYTEESTDLPGPSRKKASEQLHSPNSKEFDFVGGNLEFNDIELQITENAIRQGKKLKIDMKIVPTEEIPILKPTETRLSPVVYCGPPGTVFNKPCVLSFPHNIVDEECWEFTGLVKDEPGGIWRKIKDNDVHYKFYVQNGKCFIELAKFSLFVIVGNPKGESKPVHVRVQDDWNPHVPKTYEVYVECWRQDKYKPENAYDKRYYTYALTSDDDIIFFVENIADGWTVEKKEVRMKKHLIMERFACTFSITADRLMDARPIGTIMLKQNDEILEPYIKIPTRGREEVWEVNERMQLFPNPPTV